MIRVKVCGMTDPGNVGEIVGAKPDYIGFIFFPESPRFTGEEPDKKLFSGIPPQIKKVGVFINEDNQTIINNAISFGLNMIQLHGNESVKACGDLKSSGLGVIKVFSIGERFDFKSILKYMQVCDYFLFDTRGEKHGGSGKKFDWKILEAYTIDKPFFLSGGIDEGDAGELRSIVNRGLFAVDINSRFEISPGIKDFTKVKKFINEIKQAGYEL
jgi:phosphoribosylanthranilate isomerase